MKILLITSYFYPEKTSIGVTATDCARFCRDLGHDVTVLTGMPFFPQWKIFKEYRGKFIYSEELEGIKIKRVWLYVPKKDSTFRRIIHELSLSFFVFWRSFFITNDLIICISPFLSVGAISAIVAFIRRKKLWTYIKDLQPDAAIDLEMLKNRFAIWLSKLLEKLIYRKSERILVIGKDMIRNIKKKGIDGSKIHFVPDSFNVSGFSTIKEEYSNNNYFNNNYGIDSKFIVLHSGALTFKHNINVIMESAKKLRKNQDIFFAIVGHGFGEDIIKQEIRENKLHNIKLLPLCSQKDLPNMLASVDLTVLSQKNGMRDFTVPSKILLYMAGSKPILAAVHQECEVADLIKNNNLGIVIPTGNVDAFVTAIMAVYNNQNKYTNYGKNARQFALENYDHSVVKNLYYKPLFRDISG